jgi:hypothetical protein
MDADNKIFVRLNLRFIYDFLYCCKITERDTVSSEYSPAALAEQEAQGARFVLFRNPVHLNPVPLCPLIVF